MMMIGTCEGRILKGTQPNSGHRERDRHKA